jgi:glycosyltransferase involved in cell wall biosynthesis
LLSALARQDLETVDIQVVLAGSINSGDHEYLQAIERAIDQSGLRRRVRVIHDVPHVRVPDLLAASDVVAQPSYYEGLGLAALEAMAAGVPAVLTDTYGFNEIGAHLETALYVRPRSAADLSHALQRLLAEPDLRARLAQRAFHHVRTHFDISAMVDRLVGIYQGLEPTRARALAGDTV